MLKKILFVCKYNRFRSRIAESYFKKLNKNKKIKINSAGLIKGDAVNKKVIDVAKDYGLSIKGNTKGLEERMLLEYDLIVVVADNVPRNFFRRFYNKLIYIPIKDANSNNEREVRNRIKEIINKLKKLNKTINSKIWN